MAAEAAQRERRLWLALGASAVMHCVTLLLVVAVLAGQGRAPLPAGGAADVLGRRSGRSLLQAAVRACVWLGAAHGAAQPHCPACPRAACLPLGLPLTATPDAGPSSPHHAHPQDLLSRLRVGEKGDLIFDVPVTFEKTVDVNAMVGGLVGALVYAGRRAKRWRRVGGRWRAGTGPAPAPPRLPTRRPPPLDPQPNPARDGMLCRPVLCQLAQGGHAGAHPPPDGGGQHQDECAPAGLPTARACLRRLPAVMLAAWPWAAPQVHSSLSLSARCTHWRRAPTAASPHLPRPSIPSCTHTQTPPRWSTPSRWAARWRRRT